MCVCASVRVPRITLRFWYHRSIEVSISADGVFTKGAFVINCCAQQTTTTTTSSPFVPVCLYALAVRSFFFVVLPRGSTNAQGQQRHTHIVLRERNSFVHARACVFVLFAYTYALSRPALNVRISTLSAREKGVNERSSSAPAAKEEEAAAAAAVPVEGHRQQHHHGAERVLSRHNHQPVTSHTPASRKRSIANRP